MEKNDLLYDRELEKRFVSDFNLPIPILHDKEKFFDRLKLYEHTHGSMTKYRNVCDIINTHYEGEPKKFLNEYYDLRERMISDVLNNEAYKRLLKEDMSKYTICEELKGVPKGNVYNADNVGKRFLSIDLRKANFQALKYYDPSIVKHQKTYEDYIGRYTKLDYIKNSKYTRQVIFGKCNVSRQITIERHLMSKFYETFIEQLPDPDMLTLVRFSTDELVFEVNNSFLNFRERLGLEQIIISQVLMAKVKSGVDVSATLYTLGAICLYSTKRSKLRDLWFVEERNDGQRIFKNVPKTYNALVSKLYRGIYPTKDDYYFSFDGLDAYIDDEFVLKQASSQEHLRTWYKNDKDDKKG